MPSPYVKKLSSDTGKPVEEIEKFWDKAKGIASDHFKKSEDDFGSEEFAYTVGIVKNMLGVNEKLIDPEFFLNSKLSAREFIEDAIGGGGVSGGTSTGSSTGLASGSSSSQSSDTMISSDIDLPDEPIHRKKKDDEEEPKEENHLPEVITMEGIEDVPEVKLENTNEKKFNMNNILNDRKGWV